MNLRISSKILNAAAAFFAAVAFFSADAVAAEPASAPDLRKILAKAEPGMWVRMKNPNGLETVTVATKKVGQTLTLEVHTFRKKKPQSWVEQVIDIPNTKVVSGRIKYPDGEIDEIPVGSFDAVIEGFENYKEAGVEEVSVPAGKFRCRHFRTVVDDHLVHVYLNEKVPLTQVVKTSFQAGSSVLLEYGTSGVASVFE